MADNGVNISNREIFDAVQDIGRKLDEHIARHDERDKLEANRTNHIRVLWQTKAMWVSVVIALAALIVGAVPK